MGMEKEPSPDASSSLPLEELTCEGCGRSLAGLRVATCPDCGRPVGPSPEHDTDRIVGATIPPRAPTLADMGGPIPAEWDLRCVRCGYSLTSLTSRVCPECGLAFQPRKTWLANRLPSRKQEICKTFAGLACLCLWGIGAYFFPLWLVPLPAWLIAELVCSYLDLNPYYVRVVCGPAYIIWMVLTVFIILF